MSNSVIITPVLAAGSTASPYLFDVNITQKLCQPTCVSQTPVFAPVFSLVGYSALGNNMYVATINVQGIVSFTPCKGDACCTKTQVLNQNFSLPFTSATAPTAVSIVHGTAVNVMQGQACKSCSRIFVSETPVSLTVTTA